MGEGTILPIQMGLIVQCTFGEATKAARRVEVDTSVLKHQQQHEQLERALLAMQTASALNCKQQQLGEHVYSTSYSKPLVNRRTTRTARTGFSERIFTLRRKRVQNYPATLFFFNFLQKRALFRLPLRRKRPYPCDASRVPGMAQELLLMAQECGSGVVSYGSGAWLRSCFL